MFHESFALNPQSGETHKIVGDDEDTQWTRTERQLLVVVIICGIIIAMLVILVFLFNYQMVSKDFKKCTSVDCVIVAGEMLAKMDLSANPCDDFYQYACGKEIHSPFIPADKGKWGSFAKLRQEVMTMLKRVLDEPDIQYLGVNSTAIRKVKTYYNACMNTTAPDDLGNVPMQQLIKRIGSWPLISDEMSGSWDEGNWSLEANVAKASLLAGGSLFNFGIAPDLLNSSIYRLNIDQGGLTLQNYNFYLGNESETYHKAYLDFMSGVATLLGASESDSQDAAEELWSFESKLAEFFMTDEERQNVRDLQNIMTLETLQDEYFGTFNLSIYLNELFDEDIPMSEEFNVVAPTYLKKMSKLVEDTSSETLANYLVWQAVSGMVAFMSHPYQLLLDKFSHMLDGLTSSPQWEVCVDRTKDMLSSAIGAMYVERYFPDSDKLQIEVMAKYISDAFEKSLPEVEWMDRSTRKKALEKVKGVKTKMAYPSYLKNSENLDSYYDGLKFRKDKQFHNQIAGYSYETKRILSRRGKLVDKDRWKIGPAEVNAFYTAQTNEMVFPAAVLQEPFYDTRFPMAVNFGAIGFILGHELTHGFDNFGSYFDNDGNMLNWWTNSSRKHFDERTECLVDQYNAYPVGDLHVNGITTLNENIADTGGVKTAFNAYMKWWKDNSWVDLHANLPGIDMSEKQLFFLGFAQTWCTYFTPEYTKTSLVTDPHTYAKYRVIGSLSNFVEFSDAFGCRNGDMNPRKKCTVW